MPLHNKDHLQVDSFCVKHKKCISLFVNNLMKDGFVFVWEHGSVHICEIQHILCNETSYIKMMLIYEVRFIAHHNTIYFAQMMWENGRIKGELML